MNRYSTKMNQTVIITGASTGIGRAAAEYFASQGWNVAATMRNPEKYPELSSISGIKTYVLDVTETASIDSALSQIQKDFGRIDVLVNNAGYAVDGVFEAMNDAVFEKQFDTNVFGLMRMTRAIIPVFRAQKSGTIIQIASMGGRIAFPLFSIYHGTKWAVEGFSESLRYELEPLGIKVRIIEPGVIKTDFYTRNRVFVKPETTNQYDAFVTKCEKTSSNAGNTGTSAISVAKVIFRAATDRGNRLRYAAGNPAPMLLWLRKWMPDSWFKFLVKSSYGI